jgi:hypothetical protein
VEDGGGSKESNCKIQELEAFEVNSHGNNLLLYTHEIIEGLLLLLDYHYPFDFHAASAAVIPAVLSTELDGLVDDADPMNANGAPAAATPQHRTAWITN